MLARRKLSGRVFGDIRLYIGLFFLVRLFGITHPPLETGHNWRQALTAMIARNFVEQKASLFYPQIDYAGSGPGFIGSEFPFFNYLIYLFSEAAGYTHWYGRLINLMVSSLGIYFFCKLISRLTTRSIAFSAGIILLSSIWFAFSRKIMPDTFSVSLVIIGFYCGYEYLVSGRKYQLLCYFVFTTLGILCKIPALYLLAVLGLVVGLKEIPASRKVAVSVLSGVSFALVSLWYFFWVPHLVDTYGNQLFFPRGLAEGLTEILSMPGAFFRNFYFNAFHSYVAFIAFGGGVYLLFRQDLRKLAVSMLLLTISFLLFVLKTGIVFPLHNYYIIPFVPVMALVAAIALDRIPNPWKYLVLVVIAGEGITNQQHDFFIKDKEGYKMAVQHLTETHTDKHDLIVINGGPSPQEIYLAHRKGWSVGNEKITPEALRTYAGAGARYLVIDQRSFPDSISFLPLVAREGDFSLYSLTP